MVASYHYGYEKSQAKDVRFIIASVLYYFEPPSQFSILQKMEERKMEGGKERNENFSLISSEKKEKKKNAMFLLSLYFLT